MSDDSFWSGVVVMGVLAGSLYYCTREDEPAPPKSEPTNYSTLADAAVAGANSDAPYVPPAPTHNYDDKEGATYHYVGAVSEEQQKKGQASGDVYSVQYGGKEDGAHILITPSGRYSCEVPCKIIKGSNGARIAYSETSLIGAAFQDAMRGFLKPVPKAPKPKPIVQEAAPAETWDGWKDAPLAPESSGSAPSSVPSAEGVQEE
jgi:hypothetical protein